MTIKLLTEHHLEFPSLKGGCTGSSESTLVKMPDCWKSYVVAHILFIKYYQTMHRQDTIFDQINTHAPTRAHRLYMLICLHY